MNSKWIVASVVAIIALLCGLVLGLSITHNLTETDIPLLISLSSLAAVSVPGILALVSVEKTRNNLENGLIPKKVTEALDKYHSENPAITGATPEEVQDIVDNRDERK